MQKCLIKIECDLGHSDQSGSLMDQALAGLITSRNLKAAIVAPSDFVLTLLRDPVGSHLIETIVDSCIADVFDLIWDVYFTPQLVKLALHPTSNFVVARCISRLLEVAYSKFMDEMLDIWPKIIKANRSGVLLSAIQRSYEISEQQGKAINVSQCLYFRILTNRFTGTTCLV